MDTNLIARKIRSGGIMIKAFLIKTIYRIPSGKILNDGERFDPVISPFFDVSHIPRYKFALQYLHKGDTVLDLACGSGYGVKILSDSCKKVYGVDFSSDAIEYARNKNGSANSTFVISDFFSNKIRADVVISFETIEHLTVNHVDEIFEKLMEFSEKMIIGSVPYREKKGINRFHLLHDLDEKNFSFFRDKGDLIFMYQTADGIIHQDKPSEGKNIQNLIFIFKKGREF